MDRTEYFEDALRRDIVQIIVLVFLFIVLILADFDLAFKFIFAIILTAIFWFVVVRNSSDSVLSE